jgi:glycosyltransferase involved in cell wall biosynthesis
MVHHFPFSRLGINIFKEIFALSKLHFEIKKIQPDIVHLVTLKPIVYVGILSLITPFKSMVIAISGMGFLYTTKLNFFLSFLSKIILFLIRRIAVKNNSRIIFQNKYDQDLILKEKKSLQHKSVLVQGVGVEVSSKSSQEEDSGEEISVTMASRLLKDKGIREYFEAARLISDQRKDVRFVVAGKIDLGNPNSLTQCEYDEMRKHDFIEFMGHVSDMEELFKESNIVVLPSYREGFPKVLMEAASYSKPSITTDVPGCNEAVKHNITGLVIPSKNIQALVDAIVYLIDNSEIRKKMGRKAFDRAKEMFDEEKIINQQLLIYEELLS